MPGIYEQQRANRPSTEIRRGERLELAAASARVPDPGQIDEIQRLPAAPRDTIYVHEPRLAGGRTRPRDPASDERVDQARLPDVRTADERDLREPVPRQIRRCRR